MVHLKLPILAGLLAFTACASEGDVVVLGEVDSVAGNSESINPLDLTPGHEVPVEPAEVPARIDLEQEEEEFQRRAGTPLSDAERLKVESVLQQLDVSPDDVKFVGRMLLQTDVYTDAEELLAISDEMIEKGRVLSRIFTGTNGTPGPTPQQQVSPELYARLNGGTFQFFRPYVQHFTAVIVPTDNFLLPLYNFVNDNVNNAATDCLFGGASPTIRAMTLASFNALSATAQARVPTIRVIHGPLATACPGTLDVKGCSLGMRHRSLLHLDGVTRNTMVMGTRIGLVDTAVTGLGGQSRRTATHELLHTMGFAHPFQPLTDGDGDGKADALVVPGTSGADNTISVMQNSCPAGTDCNVANPHFCCGSQANDPTQDDIDVIDTLYSPQAGGTCAYSDAFRNIAAN